MTENYPNLAQLIESCSESTKPDWNSLEVAVFERLKSTAYNIAGHSDESVSFGATALTNETFLRLIERDQLSKIQNTQHFFALVTVMMKQVFADHHQRKKRWKAGGRMIQIPFDAVLHSLELSIQDDYDRLEDCLRELKIQHARQAEVLELQIFVALKVDEIATAMNLSKSTVEADLRFAKAFVRRYLVN